MALGVQHHPTVLDSHVETFDRRIFLFVRGLLYRDIVGADAQPVGIEDRAAAGNIELPAVPGAAQDLAIAFPDDLTGLGWSGRCR